ncbi:hypothetical protein L7F22_034864 [Adiantum nelumboides]|nr:hypothetical protein [Adiantum nelumboides]
MGPLPKTKNGKLYILVAIDYMTRWVEAQSVTRVNEKTVNRFVYTHICCRFGTPLEIVSDNGPGFRKGLLTEVCEELHILHRHSTPYYPQSNGLVEKANGIIAGIIRKMVKNKTKLWDDFLDGALWGYRTTYKEATEFTPFHLVYGQEALQPIELNIPTMRLHGKATQRKEEERTNRLLTLAELEWKREAAYECYKRKATQVKDNLDKEVKDKGIKEGDLVLRRMQMEADLEVERATKDQLEREREEKEQQMEDDLAYDREEKAELERERKEKRQQRGDLEEERKEKAEENEKAEDKEKAKKKRRQ